MCHLFSFFHLPHHAHTHECAHTHTHTHTHRCTPTHTSTTAHTCTHVHVTPHATHMNTTKMHALLVIIWWKREDVNNKSAGRREEIGLQFWSKREKRNACQTELEISRWQVRCIERVLPSGFYCQSSEHKIQYCAKRARSRVKIKQHRVAWRSCARESGLGIVWTTAQVCFQRVDLNCSMSAILEGELLSERVSHSMQLFSEVGWSLHCSMFCFHQVSQKVCLCFQRWAEACIAAGFVFIRWAKKCVSVFRGGLKPALQHVLFSSGEPQCVSVFRGGLKPELQHVSFSPSELQPEPQCVSVFREFHGEGSFYESSRSQGVWIDWHHPGTSPTAGSKGRGQQISGLSVFYRKHVCMWNDSLCLERMVGVSEF